MSDRAATAKVKIRCTDELGNVAYIHNDPGFFRCTLASGTPASMFYAVGNCDEVLLKQRLADALDEPERLLRVVQDAARGRKVEMVSYKPAPKAATTADGTSYTGKEMAAELGRESEVAAAFTKELLASGLRAMQSHAERTLEQLPAPGL